MKYDLYLELRNYFKGGFGLSERECRLIQNAYGLSPVGIRDANYLTKKTKDGREFQVMGSSGVEPSTVYITVSEPGSDKWGDTYFTVRGTSRVLVGNVVDDQGGVYYYEMTEGSELSVRYCDALTFETLSSMGIKSQAYAMKDELIKHGIVPDLQGTIKVQSCADAVALIEAEPIEFLTRVVSPSKTDTKTNQ